MSCEAAARGPGDGVPAKGLQRSARQEACSFNFREESCASVVHAGKGLYRMLMSSNRQNMEATVLRTKR